MEETIHDKYRKYINQSNSGYISGLQYGEAMEILQWCQNKLNKQIPLNTSCGACMLDLIKLFKNLE